MPKKRLKGGTSSSSPSNTTIGITTKLPSAVGDIQNNTGTTIICFALFIIILLVVLARSQVSGSIGAIGNKMSISIIGFVLGISSLSSYLLCESPQTITYFYYFLVLISLAMWLYLLFVPENFENYNDDDNKYYV